MFTATRIQVASYLFGVCLFSISFLVFLNSSISFVVTDLLKQHDGVGDAVGTLGFADELVALIACPIWGVVSDRIGVRTVCVLGYSIIGVALFLFVQAHNVFPQLLFARLFFSIGAAASSTMVTAILPSMIAPLKAQKSTSTAPPDTPINRHSLSPSVSSELTITQLRHQERSLERSTPSKDVAQRPAPTRLAGFVGLFTGFGALVALVVFLPLPAAFRDRGVDAGAAVAYSYYIVGAIALLVAASVFFGLRNLITEDGKSWANLLKAQQPKHDKAGADAGLSYVGMIFTAIVLGLKNSTLALGYLGGFVARASSVGISLFIPLFVNAWFISSGSCVQSPQDSREIGNVPAEHQCRRAYVLAAELTGVSQLFALIFAPVFGYLADRYPRFNVPLLVAAIAGILGYIGFANLGSPDPKATGGTLWVFPVVALLGISQIGAIVCSLGLLGRSILESDLKIPTSDAEATDSSPGEFPSHSPPSNNPGHPTKSIQPNTLTTNEVDNTNETSTLLGGQSTQTSNRQHLKGSVAGVYSLTGGAGILLLTKLGGYLFDNLSPAAPFYMLAIFNCVLLLSGIARGIVVLRRSE